MTSFEKVKNKVHDASGVKNPYNYYWEQKNGVYYPVELIEKENRKNDNDIMPDINVMLVDNGMPPFGTKEFNDMCSNFFGGKSNSE